MSSDFDKIDISDEEVDDVKPFDAPDAENDSIKFSGTFFLKNLASGDHGCGPCVTCAPSQTMLALIMSRFLKHLALATWPICGAIALVMALSAAFGQTTQPVMVATPIAAPTSIVLRPTGTDSTAELNQAFARADGRTITLQQGVYGVSQTICITHTSNAIIIGRNATLRALPGFKPDTSGHLLIVQDCNGVTVRNVNFDGNRTQRGLTTGGGCDVLVNWSSNIKFIGCDFRDAPMDDVMLWSGCNAAQVFGSCQNVTLSKCTLNDAPGRNHVSVINVIGMSIDSCSFSGIGLTAPQSCIDGEPNANDPFGCESNLSITNNAFTNVFRAVSAWNIAGTGPTGIYFTGNTVTNAAYGIENQWAIGRIANNNFVKVGMPILTGSYMPNPMPVKIGPNTFDAQTGPPAIAATDLTN